MLQHRSLLKIICWERLKAGEGDDRGWDGRMASPNQWTWVWVSSRSWWWTGKPGVLQSMGSQRVTHDWATELNWTDKLTHTYRLCFSLLLYNCLAFWTCCLSINNTLLFLPCEVEICYFLHQDISYLSWNFFSSSFTYLVPSNNAMFSLDSTQENHKGLAQDFSSWLTRLLPLDFWTWHQVFCHWYFFSDKSFTLRSINGSVFLNVI